MYEFTKKEVREKFKKTELGRKYNLYLICSGIISLILFISLFIIDIMFGGDINNFTSVQWGIFAFNSMALVISLLFTCYLDGKRDGAISQYSLKNK